MTQDHDHLAAASEGSGGGACAWTQEDDEGAWATDCGELFVLNDGVPSENRMRFCCYCGGALTELLVADFAELDAAASPEGTAE